MTTAIKPPTFRTGKICYIEIPATDIHQSAEFYKRAFGWQIRQRGNVFDRLRRHRQRGQRHMGPRAAAEAVVAAGGEIVRPIDPTRPRWLQRSTTRVKRDQYLRAAWPGRKRGT